MEKNNDSPAFPQTVNDLGTIREANQGMTLRDYFAAAALTGLAATGAYLTDDKGAARESWALADAMLAERSK